jgi:hypothetical protein
MISTGHASSVASAERPRHSRAAGGRPEEAAGAEGQPPIYQNSGLCSLGSNLLFFQVCMIGVFFVSVLPTLRVLMTELAILRIFFHEDQFRVARFFRTRRTEAAIIVSLTIVLYELLVFIAVLQIGILYILTSNGVGNIVQALSYINDIGNMVGEAVFINHGIRGRERRYRCKDMPTRDNLVIFTWAFLLPGIIGGSCGLEYGIRNTYCS